MPHVSPAFLVIPKPVTQPRGTSDSDEKRRHLLEPSPVSVVSDFVFRPLTWPQGASVYLVSNGHVHGEGERVRFRVRQALSSRLPLGYSVSWDKFFALRFLWP